MFAWIGRWWRRRQRRADLDVLWPVCVERAPQLSLARAVFEVHARSDKAWTKDMTPEQIHAFIQGLEAP